MGNNMVLATDGPTAELSEPAIRSKAAGSAPVLLRYRA